MKIINYILCFVAIIGSFYVIITKDDSIGVILKDLAIIITIPLLYILERIFKLRISEYLKFIYILFIFGAHFLGATIELYNHVKYFDKLIHTLSGILTAFASLALLSLSKKYDNRSKIFNILWMISFSLAVAACWEIFEYGANILFGGDAQHVALTGVNDTMQDIIVAFLGAILVCIVYGFYNNLKLFDFTNSVKKID